MGRLGRRTNSRGGAAAQASEFARLLDVRRTSAAPSGAEGILEAHGADRVTADGGATPAATAPHPLVALTTKLAEVGATITAPTTFRDALRERILMAEPAPTLAEARRTAAMRRVRRRWITGAAVGTFMLGSAGTAAASSSALPGDPLYGVKRGIESTRIALARDDLSRGRLYLEQADRRLAEAQALLQSDAPADHQREIDAVLGDLTDSLRAGTDRVIAAQTPASDEARQTLNDFVAASAPKLASLQAAATPAAVAAGVQSAVAAIEDVTDRTECLPGCGPVTDPPPVTPPVEVSTPATTPPASPTPSESVPSVETSVEPTPPPRPSASPTPTPTISEPPTGAGSGVGPTPPSESTPLSGPGSGLEVPTAEKSEIVDPSGVLAP